MSPLLSIIVPSRRPSQLEGMLDNLEEVTSDFSRLELVVKVDDDVEDASEILEREKKRRPFKIRYVCTPRHGGVFTLWAGQHEAFQASNPDTYFYVFASDELRILTPGWDDLLMKYVGWFEDDVFRLRLSDCKYRNYHRMFDCTFMPDSFALITRRWLELAEGTGHCWGTDAFHQCVAYHLSNGAGDRFNIWHTDGYWRDVQVHDIALGGMEFGKDISAREFLARNLRIMQEWLRLTSYPSQERFSYLARRIQIYCDLHSANYTRKYVIEQRKVEKLVVARAVDDGEILKILDYRVPALTVLIENFMIRIKLLKNMLKGFIYYTLASVIFPRDLFSGSFENLPKVIWNYPYRKEVHKLFRAMTLRPSAEEIQIAEEVAGGLVTTKSFRFRIRRTLGSIIRISRTIITAPFLTIFWIFYVAAPGLEHRWSLTRMIKDALFRRIGYPVADRKELFAAYNRMTDTEATLRGMQFTTNPNGARKKRESNQEDKQVIA